MPSSLSLRKANWPKRNRIKYYICFDLLFPHHPSQLLATPYTNKGNISKTWKTIREIVPNTKNISSISNFDNVLDETNKFNSHFANIGKNSYIKTQEVVQGENVQHPVCENVATGVLGEGSTFRPQPEDTNIVTLTLRDINKTSCVDSDGIPRKFIKDALCIIVTYITCIVNTSIITGIFPTAFTHALIVPLHMPW